MGVSSPVFGGLMSCAAFNELACDDTIYFFVVFVPCPA